MQIRTSHHEISTPAYARSVAIKASTHEPEHEGNVIICRVFTAFMVEGVISHIGYMLDPKWLTPQKACKPNSTPERQSIGEKHKHIRKFLGLDNGNVQFQEKAELLGKLITFRDAFAHPQMIRDTTETIVPDVDMYPLPPIGWQTMVDATSAKKDFENANAYCIELLDAAADMIELEAARDWTAASAKFPNHTMNNTEIACGSLRSFLHFLSTGLSSYRLEDPNS